MCFNFCLLSFRKTIIKSRNTCVLFLLLFLFLLSLGHIVCLGVGSNNLQIMAQFRVTLFNCFSRGPRCLDLAGCFAGVSQIPRYETLRARTIYLTQGENQYLAVGPESFKARALDGWENRAGKTGLMSQAAFG